MSRKILGLDIRSDRIAAVVIDSSIKGDEVKNYYHVSWEPSSEKNAAEIADALKTIAENIDLSEVECVASFPADQASYRNIRVPFKETRKIKQVLPFELESTMPLPSDQTVIDFQNVSHPKQQEQTDVLVAVMGKARLDEFLSDVKTIKLNPQVATISGYSVALGIAKQANAPDQCVVVDVYHNRATLFAISSGQIQIIRSTVFNSSTAKPAESICKGIVQTASAAEDMLDIEFLPETVFVTGSGADSVDFQQDIANTLELTVKPIDLVQDIGVLLNESDEHPWKPEQMDNALALAIVESSGNHGLNFNRRQFAAKKHWITYRKDIIKTGILASIILFLLLLSLLYDFYSIGADMDNLDAQVSKIYKNAFPNSTIEDTFVQQRQMRITVDELKTQSIAPGKAGKNLRSIDILNDISGLLPKEMDIELNRLVIGPENVTIAGDTATFNSVDEMKNRLEKGSIFQKVTISSANSDKTGKRITFKLKLDL